MIVKCDGFAWTRPVDFITWNVSAERTWSKSSLPMVAELKASSRAFLTTAVVFIRDHVATRQAKFNMDTTKWYKWSFGKCIYSLSPFKKASLGMSYLSNFWAVPSLKLNISPLKIARNPPPKGNESSFNHWIFVGFKPIVQRHSSFVAIFDLKLQDFSKMKGSYPQSLIGECVVAPGGVRLGLSQFRYYVYMI